MRYRLQRKDDIIRPYSVGDCPPVPVFTYRWKDIAASNDREELVKIMPDSKEYRIEDTWVGGES